MVTNTHIKQILKTVYFMILFSMLGTMIADAQLRVLPLGNSITKGIWCTTGNINNCQALADDVAVGYRLELYQQLSEAGYDPDFGGTVKSGYDLMSDPDHAGFAGILSTQLADVLETGSTTSPSLPRSSKRWIRATARCSIRAPTGAMAGLSNSTTSWC